MFFNRTKQKEKAIAQYGSNANHLFTMYMTYGRILTINDEDRKEYVLKEFSINISRRYGSELVKTFYQEFIPKYQGSSLLKELSKDVILSDEGDEIIVDAELPTEYINPDLLPLVEKFEPFGEENRDLVFVSKSLKIQDAKIM